MSEQVFLSDAVIEQGEKNGWKYRIWASGKKECWYNQSVNISGAWSAWGNTYYKRLASVGNYPFTFTKAPNFSVLYVYLEIRKKPDVIKKNGTATRAIIRVNIKSPVSLKEASGEV